MAVERVERRPDDLYPPPPSVVRASFLDELVANVQEMLAHDGGFRAYLAYELTTCGILTLSRFHTALSKIGIFISYVSRVKLGVVLRVYIYAQHIP